MLQTKNKVIFIGNQVQKLMVSYRYIITLAEQFQKILPTYPCRIWLILTSSPRFMYSTQKIIMYKKIWKNRDFDYLKKYAGHCEESIIYLDQEMVSFATVIEVAPDNIVDAYQDIYTHNGGLISVVTPPELDLFDRKEQLFDLLREIKKNKTYDYDMFDQMIDHFDGIVISRTYGWADDWDCGISFYAKPDHPFFDFLTRSFDEKNISY